MQYINSNGDFQSDWVSKFYTIHETPTCTTHLDQLNPLNNQHQQIINSKKALSSKVIDQINIYPLHFSKTADKRKTLGKRKWGRPKAWETCSNPSEIFSCPDWSEEVGIFQQYSSKGKLLYRKIIKVSMLIEITFEPMFSVRYTVYIPIKKQHFYLGIN